ncbi:hypothetical protein [Leucobacter sp. UCMA 4100]|nr:hypothetical protein [Leucobacter sp. UCMA 4100]
MTLLSSTLRIPTLLDEALFAVCIMTKTGVAWKQQVQITAGG